MQSSKLLRFIDISDYYYYVFLFFRKISPSITSRIRKKIDVNMEDMK